MKSNAPFVTIICLSYNHELYITDALQSVINQTYENIQLIVIDDASTDESVSRIADFLSIYPEVTFIRHTINRGNCRSFNEGLALAEGQYVIDLAGDDLLLPDRVQHGVDTFEQYGASYGINFSDAAYIGSTGKLIRYHYPRMENGELFNKVPQGEVFADVLRRHFICSPTTMIRKNVLDDLGGYDEHLAYEDFDLWVRASRRWKFCYSDKVLVHKRVLPSSHGQQQYKRGNRQMDSTLRVCQKAYKLCEHPTEYSALRKRISYEIKHALWLFKISLSLRYAWLWVKSIR